ncbi:MAG TPA: iron-containing alcohol dehydrogenase family protein [Micromonosporaceae bacterium]|nr:iron-containing alcohol dehydrogenase family protein [Micromonosporaceae bacterium]
MPLLARTVMTPLTIEISRGALGRLDAVVADGRISGRGRVAVVLGTGIGPDLVDQVSKSLPAADLLSIDAGTYDSAIALAERLKAPEYDAVVGVGGGKIIDTVKYAASQRGMSMVAVATSLAHDGLASPVSTLAHLGGYPSYGVHIPIAVVVDLDIVARSPAYQIRSGIGDELSNLSACADWELSHAITGEPIDGLALSLARTGAEAVLDHPGTITDVDFLATLARSLVLGGVAMAVAGSSRPCSGACHEITHALTARHPDAASHGVSAGLGALFAMFLRTRVDTAHGPTFRRMASALGRHGVPRRPADIGLTATEFADVVAFAPATRPGRYTILEHLSLDPAAVVTAVEEFVDAVGDAR